MGNNDFVTPGPGQKASKAVLEISQCQAGVAGLTDDCPHFTQHLSVDVGAHSWACRQAVQELLLLWVWGNERPTVVTVTGVAVSASIGCDTRGQSRCGPYGGPALLPCQFPQLGSWVCLSARWAANIVLSKRIGLFNEGEEERGGVPKMWCPEGGKQRRLQRGGRDLRQRKILP
jgi:hypothetical protein